MTAPPSNRDQSRAHEGANIGRRCVSYFTLRTIIIFMETIKDLYQTLAPLASRKALQRFCPSPGSSTPKTRHSEPTALPKARDRGPRPKDPPGIGSHWRIPARTGEAEETPRVGRPPSRAGAGGSAPDPICETKRKTFIFQRDRCLSLFFLSLSFFRSCTQCKTLKLCIKPRALISLIYFYANVRY